MSRLRALRAWCAAGAMLSAAFPAGAYHERADAGFDYYVLSLSWAPSFCQLHPDDKEECGRRRGFVVHGLWPQYAGGGGPSHCGSAEPIDPETVERVKSAMPDERLIRHEWVVHGTCSGLSAHDYFVSMLQAVGRLSIPEEFDGQAPRRLTAGQVVSAFVKANPSLSPRSFAVRCHGPRLEEVRICLSRELEPLTCGADVHTQCRTGPLEIDAAP